MTALARLLESRIGLDCASLGPSALAAALAERMRASACASEAEYLALAGADEREMEKLIEEVVVSETWFMRDREPFAELARVARRQQGSGPFRVLTLPCATGEEPYSVAISLLEAGTSLGFTVDAVDVSQRALARAALGVFRDGSFRADDGSLRRRWFTETQAGWAIDPALIRHVTFRHGNVLDESLAGVARYDAIFCRNLLIYLGTAARARAIRNLRRALAPGGTLFVGHAEALECMDPAFARVAPTSAFAYRVREGGADTGRHVTLEATARSSGRPLDGVAANRLRSSGASTAPLGASPSSARTSFSGSHAEPRASTPGARAEPRTSTTRAREAPPHEPLADARALADRGRLEEAQALCERELARDPSDPQAYALLGVVLQARGDVAGARRSLERALYLDPEREEALAHLVLLYERAGEAARAEVLRRRAERVRGRRGARP